jgi:hypothetical protein
MFDPSHDPFFEQLKADIELGAAEDDRGETLTLEDAIAQAKAVVLKIAAERDTTEA